MPIAKESETNSKSSLMISPSAKSELYHTPQIDQVDTTNYRHPSMIEGPWSSRKYQFQNVLLHVCSFILILEFAERVSYYGINQGLKNYMGKLGWSQVGSNSLKSSWTSLCYLSPLFGGYIADEKWGRFKTLIFFGIWYTIGAFMVAISAYPSIMRQTTFSNILCNIGLFFGVAIGTGAIKANVITFGADQFDPNKPEEMLQKENFFSYFYFVINLGAIFSYAYLSVLCVEGSGKISPEYGYFACFLICGGIIVIAYILFLLASPRYVHFSPQNSSLTKLFSILRGNCAYSYEARMLWYGLVAFGNSFLLNLIAAFLSDVANIGQYLSYLSAGTCFFGMYVWIRYGMNAWYMDKSKASNGGQYNDEIVDDIKMVIRILPFASFMIVWEAVYDQIDANFQSITQQCDLRLHPKSAHLSEGNVAADDVAQVPGAMLGVFDPLTILFLIPILDGIVYPLYRRCVGKPPSAFGKVLAGLVISTVTMFYVGSFEVLRRNSGKLEFFNQTSGKYEPILDAGSQQPMNKLYWAAAIPNYVLVALAECLINVTAYDVFYNEVPLDLKSTCQAINLFMVAMGSNVTSIFTLLFQGFIPQDLNEGNLEYMYYALGGLSVFNVLAYVFVMHSMQFGMVPNEEDQDRGGVDDGDEARGSELCYINSHSSIESISLS